MKKLALVIIMSLLISLIGVTIIVNGTEGVNVTVNGKMVNFPDAKPFIDENGRTLLPVRFVTEELGATVEWNAGEQKAYVKKDATIVTIKINDKDILVNGLIKRMDTKAIIKEDRTFVPIRYTAESLGASVGWDGSTRTVIISTGQTVPTHTATPTPVSTNAMATYEPSKWVSVDYDGEEDELYLNIPWSSDFDRFEANCKYAETVITNKYNYDIAKEVVDIARKKTDRFFQLYEIIEHNGKKVEVTIHGSSISIIFWKVGVI